jgi:hypothetical protein
MEQTECSETSAYKIQTPGNYPEENIQHLYLCSEGTCSKTRPGYKLFGHNIYSSLQPVQVGTGRQLACVTGYRLRHFLTYIEFTVIITVETELWIKTLERHSPNHDTIDHFSSHCGFFVHGRQIFSTSVACNRDMHEEIMFYNYLFYRFGGLVLFYFYCIIFVMVTLVWRILLLHDLFYVMRQTTVRSVRVLKFLLHCCLQISDSNTSDVLCADVLTQGT